MHALLVLKYQPTWCCRSSLCMVYSIHHAKLQIRFTNQCFSHLKMSKRTKMYKAPFLDTPAKVHLSWIKTSTNKLVENFWSQYICYAYLKFDRTPESSSGWPWSGICGLVDTWPCSWHVALRTGDHAALRTGDHAAWQVTMRPCGWPCGLADRWPCGLADRWPCGLADRWPCGLADRWPCGLADRWPCGLADRWPCGLADRWPCGLADRWPCGLADRWPCGLADTLPCGHVWPCRHMDFIMWPQDLVMRMKVFGPQVKVFFFFFFFFFFIKFVDKMRIFSYFPLSLQPHTFLFENSKTNSNIDCCPSNPILYLLSVILPVLGFFINVKARHVRVWMGTNYAKSWMMYFMYVTPRFSLTLTQSKTTIVCRDYNWMGELPMCANNVMSHACHMHFTCISHAFMARLCQ